MKEPDYPFDPDVIIRKKKQLKKQLLISLGDTAIEKRIAILGGQTTQNIKLILELFLLSNDIKPTFYESEYNRYYEDGMFPCPELEAFAPDIIYICTSVRNISSADFPAMTDTAEDVALKKRIITEKFTGLWESIAARYRCPIVQNNFEYPFFRLLGNRDAVDIHGRVNFVTALNTAFYEYAQSHDFLHICDVNYISASYGLEKWSDPYYWHMYKYAVAVPAIPYLSFNVANIIKSIYGRNKKAFNLDLDNTLWGGVIGDDGAENIEIGQETPLSQVYSEFQEYLKLHKQLGIMLTVNSKNDEANALSGFERPDSILRRDDFASFKANWNPKSTNLSETAGEMSLLPESFVFVDDNPAEREIVRQHFPGTAVPEIKEAEHYIQAIDKAGYFEVTSLSADDLTRNRMYQDNAKRQEAQAAFSNYEDYLISLEMEAEIDSFAPVYMGRIAQLTNKSNQFNLTTKRYSLSEIENVAADPGRIALYGKLTDRFGDNGVVSIVIGRIDGPENDELHMELWLMSCRVLKRDMEYAMMDELEKRAREMGIRKIVGYYIPTAKNAMVKDLYGLLGFEKVSEDDSGNTVWEYMLKDGTAARQNAIKTAIRR
ncbi:MAG: HAD-IIIC family phosphatase [Lachnospiraceae bacterium]|nr:HAD-IIIC family phosphatase [Lachnospiraceae bacterium]